MKIFLFSLKSAAWFPPGNTEDTSAAYIAPSPAECSPGPAEVPGGTDPWFFGLLCAIFWESCSHLTAARAPSWLQEAAPVHTSLWDSTGGLLYRVSAPFGQRERSENGRDGLTHLPCVLKWVSFMWQREFPSFAFFPKVVWKMSWAKMSPLISLFLLYLFYFKNTVGAVNLYEKLLLGGLYFKLILEI